MKEKDVPTRFTIRDEETMVPDPSYVADIENLRIEKLNKRITRVALLILGLLTAALVLVYLDIQHRVVNTHHTGSMGVQNLSKDLESRFSSLSLKQARIEEQLTEHANALENTGAAFFRLQKETADFKRAAEGKVDRSELAATAKRTETAIDTLQREIVDLRALFTRFDEELAGRIIRIADGIEKDQGRLAQVEQHVQRLESEKLNRAAMELALGLERLTLQEMVRERIRELDKKIDLLGKQIERLDQRLAAQAMPAAAAPAPAAASGIQEQPID